MSQYILERACREFNFPEEKILEWWFSEDWNVEIIKSWCMWLCKKWPNVKIEINWKEEVFSNMSTIKIWDKIKQLKKENNLDL